MKTPISSHSFLAKAAETNRQIVQTILMPIIAAINEINEMR